MRAKSCILTGALLVGWLSSTVQAQQAIRWQQTLQMAKQSAAQSNRLVLVHFWSPSCAPCAKMEQEVFSRPDVAAAVEANYVPVKLNADYFPSTARQYGVTALPTDLVLSSQGQIVERIVGFRPAAEYIAAVNWIADNAKNSGTRVYAQIPGAGPQAGPSDGGAMAQSVPREQAGPALPPSTSAFAGTWVPPSSSGHLANSGLSTAPTWPPYSGSAQAPQAGPSPATGGPFGGNTPGTAANSPPPRSQGMPAWWQGGTAVPPSQPSAAQNPTQPAASTPMMPGASAQPGLAAKAGPPSLPPGMYPLGLDGYCPVSLREKGRWVAGNRRWGAFHQGRTYLFSGPEEQERFLKNPDPYAPVLAGNDVVLMVEQRQAMPGQRRFGAWYDDRVYLFASEAAYQKFYNDAPRYAAAVMQSMGASSNPGYR